MPSLKALPRSAPGRDLAPDSTREHPAYGIARRLCQAAPLLFLGVGLVLAAFHPAAAAEGRPPTQIVAFGDSLSAGYQLPEAASFPAVLQDALEAAGIDAAVTNAGVSGDTSQDGLQRVDWSVPDGTDAVILELGANDMLRGLDPKTTQANLDAILARLQARHIKVLLCGMRGLPSLGPDYTKAFEAIYPALARKYDVPLYPFFLQGVAQDATLKLGDGMHPNPAGVKAIVRAILPSVEALLHAVPPPP